MEEQFVLKYRGGRVDAGEMDALEVAEAIKGFAAFTQRIGTGIYGSKAEFETTVRGFRKGSFEIELLYRLLSPEAAGAIASAMGPIGDLVSVIKECFEVLKHLEGKPPKTITKGEGSLVYVENNNGVINQFNDVTVNLALDPRVGRATRDFVRAPLERSANEIEIVVDGTTIARADRSEADAFVPVDTSDTLIEHTHEVYVMVQTAVLEGKTQWKFSDGKISFTAPIEDESFLARVEAGRERFGHGDTLRVRLRAIQKQTAGKLKAEYVIEKVLEHTSLEGTQGNLL